MNTLMARGTKHGLLASQHWFAALLAFFVVLSPAFVRGEVRLARVFGDHMVLQRSSKASIWGTASSGEQITLRLSDGDATVTTTARADGRWIATFDGLQPGGPFVLTVTGKTDSLVVNDVLVGDVWICSGQSNMEYQLKDADELAEPPDPQLRQLLVPKNWSLDPETEIKVPAPWVSASPATRATFTAVGYYFGKKLRRELGVPIGLIHTSWGGTAAELWMPVEVFDSIPQLRDKIGNSLSEARNLDRDAAKFAGDYSAWERRYGPIDPGNKGFAAGWANPEFDAADWKTISTPGDWTDLQVPNGGAIWIRRTISISSELAGKDLRINLDSTSGFDTTYFNGEQIGQGGTTPPYFWGNGRSYVIPGRLVKAGKNLLAVRVVTQSAKNRAFGFANRLNNKISAADQSPWTAKVETAFAPLAADAAAAEPHPPTANPGTSPTVLFNGMVSPLLPYGIKGAIWYQGEANAGRGFNYRTVFPALIGSWRKKWGIGDFPFYFVQLANLGTTPLDPNEPVGWAEVRESQLVTWQSTKNTGMAVTIDIGDAHNIHPADKRDVGDRLALFALAQDYGKRLEYSGPVYSSMKVEGSKIRLSFTHTGAGLTVKDGGPLKMFAIAGQNGKFFWADAALDGNQVVVSSKNVPSPVAVRYAWFSNPEGANLFNRDGLPATPFRTDTWATQTANIW